MLKPGNFDVETIEPSGITGCSSFCPVPGTAHLSAVVPSQVFYPQVWVFHAFLGFSSVHSVFFRF